MWGTTAEAPAEDGDGGHEDWEDPEEEDEDGVGMGPGGVAAVDEVLVPGGGMPIADPRRPA